MAKLSQALLCLLLFALSSSPALAADLAEDSKNFRVIVVDAELDRIQFGDGDTFRYRFERSDGVFDEDGKPYRGSLRLLGYDTPEKMAVGLGMYYNQTCGPRASQVFKEEMMSARRIQLHLRVDLRTKGRVLAHVVYTNRRGKRQTIAATMLRKGLAYETVSVFGDNGFPQFHREIMQAWRNSPIFRAIDQGRAPAFMSPYVWRKVNLQFANRPDGWNEMSEAQRDRWMREEFPRARRRALDRADERRAELLDEARRDPESRRSQEFLFHLTKLPRHQAERDCRI